MNINANQPGLLSVLSQKNIAPHGTSKAAKSNELIYYVDGYLISKGYVHIELSGPRLLSLWPLLSRSFCHQT